MTPERARTDNPPPAFTGMPKVDRTYTIHPYGSIRLGGPCRDDYARIVTRHYGANDRLTVTLQRAAMDSFLEASAKVGPIVLTGSHRTCAQQTALYKSDPRRFASPDGTAHTRGLAIDVSTAVSPDRAREVHRALTNRGWFQARADEPWHYSFGGSL